MKAIECTKYGSPDVLKLNDVDKPTPKDNEVLIKIYATTVSAGDCEIRSMSFPLWMRILFRIGFGFRGPRQKILGQELAGEIELVGQDVKLFKRGDQVFAPTGIGFGAYAQYKCMKEGVIAIKPSNMTYDEATTIPTGGLNALHFLRKANIQSGQKVLIIGAGGSIGTYGVQLAKYYGAQVTSIDIAEKLEMLLSIGSDKVIDYTQEDFTKNKENYDVIFDIVGKSSFRDGIKSLKENGIYLLASPTLSKILGGKWATKSGNKKVISGTADYRAEDLVFLKKLIEDEKLKAVIDRSYPLVETAEGHSYVDTGQKSGNVVITVQHMSEEN